MCGTPVTLEALELLQGAVDDRSQTLALGCWGASATDIVRPGAEVVILGHVPDPPVGIMSLTGASLRTHMWLGIDGDDRHTNPAHFRVAELVGLTVDEAFGVLEAVSVDQ